MIEKMFFAIAALGLLFLLISVKWQSITFGSLAVIMWLGCSIGAYQYEIPYQYSSLGVVYETTHTFEMDVLSWIFMLMALISMLHLFILIYDLLKGKKPKMM